MYAGIFLHVHGAPIILPLLQCLSLKLLPQNMPVCISNGSFREGVKRKPSSKRPCSSCTARTAPHRARIDVFASPPPPLISPCPALPYAAPSPQRWFPLSPPANKTEESAFGLGAESNGSDGEGSDGRIGATAMEQQRATDFAHYNPIIQVSVTRRDARSVERCSAVHPRTHSRLS